MKKQVKNSQNVPNTITSSVDGTEQIQNNRRIIFPALAEPSLFTGAAAAAAANSPMSHYHAVSAKGSHPVFQCGILTGTCNLTNQRPGVNGAVSTELMEVLDEVERVLSLAPSLPNLGQHRHQ